MFVLLLLIVSVGVGMLLRRWGVIRHIERSATWTVWLLIFVFGISLGGNKEIVNDFARFGASALLLALAGVAGSVLVAWSVTNYIDKRNHDFDKRKQQ